MKSFGYLFIFLFAITSCKLKQNSWIKKVNQEVEIVQYGPDTIHARGLAIHKNFIFTANSNGLVYRYNTKTKKSIQLTNNSHIELRDITVFDSNHFVIMQSNDTSIISHFNAEKEMIFKPKNPTFFDGMDFNKEGFGVLMGDPINGQLQVYKSKNYGLNWLQCKSPIFDSIEGEAGFAASGTTIQVIDSKSIYFVTGGKKANLYKTNNLARTWTKLPIPFESSDASGPFSIFFKDSLKGICVGGDYSKPNSSEKTCFYTKDGGKTWKEPKILLNGYRSSITYINGKLFAGGTNGIDVSFNFGKTWSKFSNINTLALNSFEGKLIATTIKGQFVIFGK